VLSDFLGDLLGSVLGDELTERRSAKATSKQLAAFAAGEVVAVPCALREPDARWRHGALRLVKGQAAWIPRFRKSPEVTLARGAATAVRSRRVGPAEAFGVNPNLFVLAYAVEGRTLELALRPRDLPILGRVLEIPASQI
jgi:hypothetical protein